MYVRSFGSVLDLCIIQVLCNSQFKVDGRWHTWIDFDKFIELVSLLCIYWYTAYSLLQSKFTTLSSAVQFIVFCRIMLS